MGSFVWIKGLYLVFLFSSLFNQLIAIVTNLLGCVVINLLGFLGIATTFFQQHLRLKNNNEKNDFSL